MRSTLFRGYFNLFQSRVRPTAVGFATASTVFIGTSPTTQSQARSLLSGNPFQTPPSYRIRTPPETAPTQRVIPLIFLSAHQWDSSSSKGQTSLAAMFAEQGYTCIEIDLPPPKATRTPGPMLDAYADELASQIRLSGYTFKPCLVSRSTAGSLIAQRYVESNPLSGLIMISPTPSILSPEAKTLLEEEAEEFTYEPQFPILIVDTPERFENVHRKLGNRLLEIDGGEAVDRVKVKDVDGQEAFVGMSRWLDEVGL